MRQEKGRQFERDIAKRLSLWWTKGERDDVFWRTAGSGARATVRSKKGVSTSGSFGDIGYIDPEGLPLIDTCVIELKRGDTYETPWDLMEKRKRSSNFLSILQKIDKEREESGREGWMLISKRDLRQEMLYIDVYYYMKYFYQGKSPSFFSIFHLEDGDSSFLFIAMRLEDFFSLHTPDKLIREYKERK